MRCNWDAVYAFYDESVCRIDSDHFVIAGRLQFFLLLDRWDECVMDRELTDKTDKNLEEMPEMNTGEETQKKEPDAEAYGNEAPDETQAENGTPEKERTIQEVLDQEELSKEELNKLKSWLFKENVRIISASKELEQMQEQLQKEKEQFQEEMKSWKRKVSVERDRLKEDNLFFEKKMDILKGGFEQLDMDRRRLAKEWAKLEAQKEVMTQPSYNGMGRDVSAFFGGVRNPLALKKRYKDLIKIFHPDNVAGDKEIIQMINIEYENLKRDYETGKWA